MRPEGSRRSFSYMVGVVVPFTPELRRSGARTPEMTALGYVFLGADGERLVDVKTARRPVLKAAFGR